MVLGHRQRSMNSRPRFGHSAATPGSMPQVSLLRLVLRRPCQQAFASGLLELILASDLQLTRAVSAPIARRSGSAPPSAGGFEWIAATEGRIAKAQLVVGSSSRHERSCGIGDPSPPATASASPSPTSTARFGSRGGRRAATSRGAARSGSPRRRSAGRTRKVVPRRSGSSGSGSSGDASISSESGVRSSSSPTLHPPTASSCRFRTTRPHPQLLPVQAIRSCGGVDPGSGLRPSTPTPLQHLRAGFVTTSPDLRSVACSGDSIGPWRVLPESSMPVVSSTSLRAGTSAPSCFAMTRIGAVPRNSGGGGRAVSLAGARVLSDGESLPPARDDVGVRSSSFHPPASAASSCRFRDDSSTPLVLLPVQAIRSSGGASSADRACRWCLPRRCARQRASPRVSGRSGSGAVPREPRRGCGRLSVAGAEGLPRSRGTLFYKSES